MNKNAEVSSMANILFVALLSVVGLGCVAEMVNPMADSLGYVRQHKGDGSRVAMLGTEAELTDDLMNHINGSYVITREPHCVFAYGKNSSYAFYFYPSQVNGQTEVEIITASEYFKPEDVQEIQAGAFFGFFSLKHINTKLLIEGNNPSLKKGAALALKDAAYSGDREKALQLVSMSADVDLAINLSNEHNAIVVQCLSVPACREIHDKLNLGIQMLNGLRGEADKTRKTAKRKEAEKENEASFQASLRAYQTAVVKPELTEDVRKFKVQAEGAVRDKDFSGAVDLYGRALKIAPWWPEGHFNRALVLGEEKDFDTAIIEMKRYLTLVPNAPNARAAQDKIYDWERKADSTSK